MNSERRLAKRVPVRFSVRYNYESPSLAIPETHVLNLSAVGVRMECYAWLVPGASIAFHMITPEHRVMDARGRVIYIESHEQPPHHVGIQFTSLTPADRATLENELEQLQTS